MELLFKSRHSPRASALVVSLLLMGFLIVLGLGLSSLVIDSVRIEGSVVNAGKAYFSAEAGVERALYEQENHIPGYETNQHYSLSNQAEVNYQIVAQELHNPCPHRLEEWRALQIQESVSWPLFRWDAEADQERLEISHFDLSYFVDRGEDHYLGVQGNVLRWKILGIDQTGGHTESISGLLGYDSSLNPNHLNSQETANFYDGRSGSTFVNFSDYPIQNFLEDHYFNYLILTNVLELSDQDFSVQDPDLNSLKLQLSTEDEDSATPDGTACEYALIESNGVVGQASQGIDVQVQLDSALPVYDFVLYQTE